MKKNLLLRKHFVIVFLFSVAVKNILAQPFSLDDRIQPIELKLIDYKKDDPKKKGKICVANITQTKDTMYFFANGFSIFSPAYVGVTGAADAEVINVSLHKENWHQANQSGQTDDKKHWETKFKTEGDFGIMVIPKKVPATYAIVIWQGAEVKPSMPSIFKKDDGSSSGGGIGGFFKQYWMYLLIGLLVLAVIFLFLKMKKQKQ